MEASSDTDTICLNPCPNSVGTITINRESPREGRSLCMNYIPDTLFHFGFLVIFFSAGIGRTGVLITMETAMCLIECNQPVYPLDIVRTMRDQRAMMIQTPVSIVLAVLCCRRVISYYLVI